MKVMLTGARGQVGRAMIDTAPADVDIATFDRAALDIGDRAAVIAAVEREAPDLIVNAAAYTAVDRAESEPDIAMRANGEAVAHLSAAAGAVGARLVQLSTDFVFDGRGSTPYPPDAATAPLSVYGRTKLAGERAAGPDALIVRTAWVYAAKGSNFVHTMLRLMRERDAVSVVTDQIGTPSHAPALAAALWGLAAADARGIYHYTDSGVASWYDFSVAIQEEALTLGMLDRAVPVIPVATPAFPTPARRPAYSVLDKQATWATLGHTAPHWRVNLRRMLGELREND